MKKEKHDPKLVALASELAPISTFFDALHQCILDDKMIMHHRIHSTSLCLGDLRLIAHKVGNDI